MSKNVKQEGINRVDHIAIAVSNLEEAITFYEKQLQMPCFGIETIEEQGVRVAKLDAGNTHIELLEPLSDESPVGKFLKARGPGLHHICFGVSDISASLTCLKQNNISLINQEPKIGANKAKIAFIHPRSTMGTLIELSQKA